jgi:GNAT superfamily N-acetyltransferase
MSKCGGGGGRVKSGGGKNVSKGMTDTLTTSRKMTLSAVKGATIRLRAAIFNEDGSDKDPTESLAPFMKFDRNGLDVEFEFVAGSSLPLEVSDFAVDLTRDNMEEVYDSSGYGWDDMDKMEEICDDASRFLIIRETGGENKLVGFAHFRFTLSGEVREEMAGEPTVLIFDVQLIPEVQRKGLGKHIMQTLELIGRGQKMTYMMAPIVNGNDCALGLFNSKLKGFESDEGHDPDGDHRQVFSKCIDKQFKAKQEAELKAKSDVAELAMQIAAMTANAPKPAATTSPKKAKKGKGKKTVSPTSAAEPPAAPEQQAQ